MTKNGFLCIFIFICFVVGFLNPAMAEDIVDTYKCGSHECYLEKVSLVDGESNLILTITCTNPSYSYVEHIDSTGSDLIHCTTQRFGNGSEKWTCYNSSTIKKALIFHNISCSSD
jgi:hypothetical protein